MKKRLSYFPSFQNFIVTSKILETVDSHLFPFSLSAPAPALAAFADIEHLIFPLPVRYSSPRPAYDSVHDWRFFPM